MKKGELSINMIIMVVIAIIILVIIVFLVARSGNDANENTSCPTKGGICKDYCSELLPNPDAKCPSGQYCCKIIS